MSDRKFTKGTYYSCQHQEINKSECNTCNRERERERERESNSQEAQIKRKRYEELGNLYKDNKLEELEELPWMGNLPELGDDRTEEEARQENERIRKENQEKKKLKEEMKQLENWGNKNLGANEYWRDGNISSTIPTHQQGTNTTAYGCQVGNCNKPRTLVEIHSNANDERTNYKIKEDCYLKGDNDFICANCYEGKKPNIPNNNDTNSAIPNSVLEYFQKNNVKSIELKDNKWLITYKDEKETKTILVANTPPQIQPLRVYFQQKGINSLDSSELENQTTNPKPINYLPWILGIGGGLLFLGVIIYFLTKKSKRE